MEKEVTWPRADQSIYCTLNTIMMDSRLGMSPVRSNDSVPNVGIIGDEKFYFSWRTEQLWYESVAVAGHLAFIKKEAQVRMTAAQREIKLQEVRRGLLCWILRVQVQSCLKLSVLRHLYRHINRFLLLWSVVFCHWLSSSPIYILTSFANLYFPTLISSRLNGVSWNFNSRDKVRCKEELPANTARL